MKTKKIVSWKCRGGEETHIKAQINSRINAEEQKKQKKKHKWWNSKNRKMKEKR